jgi:hypothetical protein
MLILITALRIIRWYCLDRIFISFERCWRSRC